ncbi:MAG: hypothetical protein K8F92_16345 [Hyphomicrobium sp.]|uniref:hypothetical protein n=1 Tax=Hyphomicrobium sp. TaxID=82 RepID=UPI001326E5D1|nr:hypothetical protein [Hyphomicrobium sp.]KAB2942951.1 MAG: hypothetical protein F9K20_05680 [Hyphomicrobium sp.]MBZ0211202.1 hypothetical protein [Hyphomicrobium sp.]
MSAAKLASILATPPLTERAIRQLVERGYLVKRRRGAFDLTASVQGYQRYLYEAKAVLRRDENIVSAARLGAILAVGERWMRMLADDGYLVKTGRAEYELAASVQGYVRFVRETASAARRKPRRDAGRDPIEEGAET